MHRDQDAAFAHLGVVALGFELGNAHADERADDAAGGRADRGAAERGHDRSGGDEGADARNRQRTDTGKPAEAGTQAQSDDAARGRPFGRLGVMFMGEVARAAAVGKQRGNVVAGKAGLLQFEDDVLGLFDGTGRAVDGCFHDGPRWSVFGIELVLDIRYARHALDDRLDARFLGVVLYRPTQGDGPVRGDELEVVRAGGKRAVAHDRLAHGGSDLDVFGVVGLVERGGLPTVPVALVDLRVIDLGGVLRERGRGRESGGEKQCGGTDGHGEAPWLRCAQYASATVKRRCSRRDGQMARKVTTSTSRWEALFSSSGVTGVTPWKTRGS